MPSYPCRHPTCTAYVPRRGDYCPAHQAEGRRERRDRDRYYDQHVRNPASRAFYNSARWARARAIKLRDEPVCTECRRAWANTVHHVKPLAECSPEEQLSQANLRSLCGPCHTKIEKEAAKCG